MFAKRLRELREEKGLSQRAVAKHLKITNKAYMHYENNGGQPRHEKLIALAKFFGVSIDYLFGLSDE